MSKEDMAVLEEKIQAGQEKAKREKYKKHKEKIKSFWSDFKKFITRGNILDMAVGVIVGGAFTAIVTALSNHILKPIINWILALLLGKDSLSEVYTFLRRINAADGSPDLTQSIYIDWGAFINAIINFVLIALTLFMILRVITVVRKKIEKRLEAENAAKAKAEEEKKKAEDAASAAAAAQAATEKAAVEQFYYEQMQKQTALLERIATNLTQN